MVCLCCNGWTVCLFEVVFLVLRISFFFSPYFWSGLFISECYATYFRTYQRLYLAYLPGSFSSVVLTIIPGNRDSYLISIYAGQAEMSIISNTEYKRYGRLIGVTSLWS